MSYYILFAWPSLPGDISTDQASFLSFPRACPSFSTCGWRLVSLDGLGGGLVAAG